MSAWSMCGMAGAITCALALAFAMPASAQDKGCPVHVVARGDSLHLIAERYLGDQDAAFGLWQANRQIVGPDPNLIEPGLTLAIPCTADASEPVPISQGDAAAPGPADRALQLAAALPAPADDPPLRRVDVLTGAPYLPFVDPAQPNGGMTTEMVSAAFAATGGPPLRIGFVDDRDSHLSVILPRGGFVLSFPWVYPDCADPGAADLAALLCTDFIASDSLYEHVTEFLARADSEWAGALSADQLTGARLCRPEGYPVDDLRGMALLPGNITLVRPPSPADCLAALDRGDVDIASLDATLTRSLVVRMPLEHPLVVLETLTRIDRLRAVARRDDPAGVAAIRRLDAGLDRIVESGDWYRIVDRHLNGAVP